jgi:hypothetical protein
VSNKYDPLHPSYVPTPISAEEKRKKIEENERKRKIVEEKVKNLFSKEKQKAEEAKEAKKAKKTEEIKPEAKKEEVIDLEDYNPHVGSEGEDSIDQLINEAKEHAVSEEEERRKEELAKTLKRIETAIEKAAKASKYNQNQIQNIQRLLSVNATATQKGRQTVIAIQNKLQENYTHHEGFLISLNKSITHLKRVYNLPEEGAGHSDQQV